MAPTTRSLTLQPSMQQLLLEWYRPMLNRLAQLNDALIPFESRVTIPLTFAKWKKAYDCLTTILHEGGTLHERWYDLWYCIVEAGLVDFSKQRFTKDEAIRISDECESVGDVITTHPIGQWISLLFDELAFVVRGKMPYADVIRERYDTPHLMKLLERAIVHLNVLTTCYEYIQQRREGNGALEVQQTNFSVPAISLMCYEKDSSEDKRYQAEIMERITHECALQIG